MGLPGQCAPGLTHKLLQIYSLLHCNAIPEDLRLSFTLLRQMLYLEL